VSLPTTLLVCALAARGESQEIARLALRNEDAPVPKGTPDAGTRHGLISWEGPSGLFINPTSADLPRGAFALQYCVLVFEQAGTDVAGHQAVASYGITDWIELGVSGLTLDDAESTTFRGGPFVRVRLVEDETWPEVSVGGIVRAGNERLSRQTVFVTASKYVDTGGGFVRSVPLHAGLRQIWQDVNDETALIAYAGAELELPRGIFLVGEVSTKADVFEHTPYSFGVQVRRPDGFGFSIAGVQTGDFDKLGVLVGIGISFQH
jgi:hypothetical protein